MWTRASRFTPLAAALVAALAACADVPQAPTAVPPGPQGPVFLVSPGPSGFTEDFSSPTLDPAWTVVPGVRVASGFPPPANDFSLLANPGHLRYSLNPMTHGDGFVNGYQPTFGEHSCCIHDPGLELHRAFGGTDWLLETKASYHMPFTNGRQLDLRVYFGNGGPGTFHVRLWRVADVNANNLDVRLMEQTGTTASSQIDLESPASVPLGGATETTHFFRLERAGGVLTSTLSDDGVTWNPTWSHDFGSGLDGLDQRVVITGLSWFNSAGSYADWDYINVTPTVIPVDIDIKPGSNPGTIKLSSKGTIPVAILSTADFDAVAEVDRTSLTFGRTGDEASLAFCGTTSKDVNADGRLDLVCHFTTSLTGFQGGDTEGILKGETTGGMPIEGRDEVRVI